MQKTLIKQSLLLCFALLSLSAWAQTPATGKTATSAGYTYEFVENDPTRTRIYTLKNGLKVYLSEYHETPRIQTMIAVNAGGRNDPSETTGLAHYLEHIMFKGTTQLGTQDWAKEKVLLDSIEMMFEKYRTLKDPAERKAYYAQIDALSNRAAQYAIANEYDKAVAVIGAKGTNAFTTEDQTVYVNDIPSNEVSRWLTLERERFSAIVCRLFHTELEAVYEEKNRALDNDGRKVNETMYREAYAGHPYGTQTVIGTVEHLKNPSISNIRAYFAKYYVPNNMAICLSGDFNSDEVIALIDKTFGTMAMSPIRPVTFPTPKAISGNIEREVVGPTAESVSIGFPMGGQTSRDAVMAELLDRILNNSGAGLIDLNLLQPQKVLEAGTYADLNADGGILTMYGTPREGQSLEEVRALLLEQISLLQKGEFDEALLKDIITNEKVSLIQRYQENQGRTYAMITAFGNGLTWDSYINRVNVMAAITKSEVMKFAKMRLNNSITVYKRTGEDKSISKIEKPTITKVALNRDKQSAYLLKLQEMRAPQLKPQFINYKEEISQNKLPNGIEVLAAKNTENELFELNYVFEAGNNSDPKMRIAVQYLDLLGAGGMDAATLKKEFFRLGCNYSVFPTDERTYVALSGLNENFNEAVKLFEMLFAKAQADPDALREMIAGIKKQRMNAKKSKGLILNVACANYGKYGKQSAFTNVMSDGELDALSPDDLVSYIQSLLTMEHKVLYYGPSAIGEVIQTLVSVHPQGNPQPLKVQEYTEQPIEKTKVYFVNYDMVQAEVMMMARGEKYTAERVPVATIFNEYFGGNMSGIVFQELREAQGLAYSVSARYAPAAKPEASDYMRAYIGTQADKLKESMAGMFRLLNEMPQSEIAFTTAKNSLLRQLESSRVTKSDKLFSYLTAQRFGRDYDLDATTYEKVKDFKLDTVVSFQKAQTAKKPFAIFVLGSRDRVNMEVLKAYGEVQELTLEELFGY